MYLLSYPYQESTLFLVDLRQRGDLGEPRVVLRDGRFISIKSNFYNLMIICSIKKSWKIFKLFRLSKEAASSSFLDGFVLQLREAPHVELRHAGLVVGEALGEEVEVLEAGARHQILGRGEGFHGSNNVNEFARTPVTDTDLALT